MLTIRLLGSPAIERVGYAERPAQLGERPAQCTQRIGGVAESSSAKCLRLGGRSASRTGRSQQAASPEIRRDGIDLIHHEHVEPAEALARMRDADALWGVGSVNAAEPVGAACDLLATGYDGTTLSILAGVDTRNADEEVPKLLAAALHDVGLDYPQGSQEGQEAAVKTMATRVLAGTLKPMDLAVWAHRTIGHGRLALAERLVELDDAYDGLARHNSTARVRNSAGYFDALGIGTSSPEGDRPHRWMSVKPGQL